MSDERPRILLVDDEQEVVQGLRRALGRRAKTFDIAVACSAAEALVALALEPCAVVVSDLQMPGINGLELLEEIARSRPSVGRVLLTGTAEADAATRALPAAHRFLCKPCNVTRIAETCVELHRYAMQAEHASRRDAHALAPNALGSITGLAIDAATLDSARAVIASGRDALLQIVDHPALAAALLHMTGSEFLGGPTAVRTLGDAVDLVGPIYFEQMLDCGLLLPVSGGQAHAIIELAEAARARARAMSATPVDRWEIDVLATLLADIDRLGTCDMTEWHGLREPRGAAALLGLWGAPAPVVERVAEGEPDARPAASRPVASGRIQDHA
ncbi:MAG: response regulator [Kofleriaceae bacterium]